VQKSGNIILPKMLLHNKAYVYIYIYIYIYEDNIKMHQRKIQESLLVVVHAKPK